MTVNRKIVEILPALRMILSEDKIKVAKLVVNDNTIEPNVKLPGFR